MYEEYTLKPAQEYERSQSGKFQEQIESSKWSQQQPPRFAAAGSRINEAGTA